MDQLVTIKYSSNGKQLEATFQPNHGLNLKSFKCDGKELIDQSDKHLNGLLIGPHFDNRKRELLQGLKKDPVIETFIKSREDEGLSDPFQNGICRYVPWKVESNDSTKLKAILTGKENWNETPLATIEGQQFKLYFEAEMTQEGLWVKLSSVGDSDTVIGIDYRYALSRGEGYIESLIKDHYYDNGILKKVEDILNGQTEHLSWDLKQPADFAFLPSRATHGAIVLKTEEYELHTQYRCSNQENCWHLWKPVNASYVSIRPLSAQNPWRPNLTVNSIEILLSPTLK